MYVKSFNKNLKSVHNFFLIQKKAFIKIEDGYKKSPLVHNENKVTVTENKANPRSQQPNHTKIINICNERVYSCFLPLLCITNNFLISFTIL